VQKGAATVQLQQEYKAELQEIEWFGHMRFEHPRAPGELNVRKLDRKDGIDWFIYRERILVPYLYPFTIEAKAQAPGILIMEDNAPAHIHHYHNSFRQQLDLHKLIWPANSPDLNPIETIWNKMNDLLKAQIGPRMTAAGLRQVVQQVLLPFSLQKKVYLPLTPSRYLHRSGTSTPLSESISILTQWLPALRPVLGMRVAMGLISSF